MIKKDIWNTKIITNGVETFNKDFKTIQEIADELGFTYAQISDLKNNRTKKKQVRFKYYPEIIITRINKTQKEQFNEKREAKKIKYTAEALEFNNKINDNSN